MNESADSKFDIWLNRVKKFVLTLLLTSLFIILILILVKEFTKKTSILIEPISIAENSLPKQINKQTLANALRDSINMLMRSLDIYKSKVTPLKSKGTFYKSKFGSFDYVPSSSPNDYKVNDPNYYKVKLEVPGTGIAIDNVLELIRSSIGKDPIKINGECARIDGKIRISLRMSGPISALVSEEIKNTRNLQKMIGTLAKNIMKEIEPPIIAIYLIDKARKKTEKKTGIKIQAAKFSEKDSIEINQLISSMFKNKDKVDDIDAHFTRAYLYHVFEQYEQAIVSSEMAYRLDKGKEFAGILINWGNSLLELKDYAQAKQKYLEAIKIDADRLAAWTGLAICEETQKKQNSAIKCYTRALAINRNDQYVAFKIGYLYKEIGNDIHAEKYYRLASTLDPSQDATFHNWGLCLTELNKMKESLFAYRRAISINKENYSAYINYALSLSYLKRYKEADQIYRVLFKLKDTAIHQKCYLNYAILLSRTNNFKLANQYYEAALDFNKQSSNIYLFYAYSKINEGKFNEIANNTISKKCFEESIRLFGSAVIKNGEHLGEPYYGMSLAYFKLNNINRAEEHWNMALQEFNKLNPSSNYEIAERQYFRGLICDLKGEKEKSFRLKQLALKSQPFLKERSFLAEL